MLCGQLERENARVIALATSIAGAGGAAAAGHSAFDAAEAMAATAGRIAKLSAGIGALQSLLAAQAGQ